MEKNQDVNVELITNSLTEDYHLSVTVLTPSGDEHIYAIPVEHEDGCFYVDKESPSFAELLESYHPDDIRKAIDFYNSLGHKVII